MGMRPIGYLRYMPTEETTLAVFGNKLDTMGVTLQEVVRELRAISEISAQQGLLKQTQDQLREQLSTVVNRTEASQTWQQTHDANLLIRVQSEMKASAALRGECLDAIAEVKTEVDQWTNRAQGAMWALGVVFTVTHAIGITLVLWLFGTVTELRETTALTKASIATLSSELHKRDAASTASGQKR